MPRKAKPLSPDQKAAEALSAAFRAAEDGDVQAAAYIATTLANSTARLMFSDLPEPVLLVVRSVHRDLDRFSEFMQGFAAGRKSMEEAR